MRIIRSIVEMASEPFCVLYGHEWIKVKGGIYCKRCGKKSP